VGRPRSTAAKKYKTLHPYPYPDPAHKGREHSGPQFSEASRGLNPLPLKAQLGRPQRIVLRQ